MPGLVYGIVAGLVKKRRLDGVERRVHVEDAVNIRFCEIERQMLDSDGHHIQPVPGHVFDLHLLERLVNALLERVAGFLEGDPR